MKLKPASIPGSVLRPGDLLKGAVEVDVDEAFEHVDLQLEDQDEVAITSILLGEGLPVGTHEIPFDITVPSGHPANNASSYRLNAFRVGGQPDIAEAEFAASPDRMVTYAAGSELDLKPNPDDGMQLVSFGAAGFSLVLGLMTWALGSSFWGALPFLAFGAAVVGGQLWWMSRSERIAKHLSEMKLEVEPTVRGSGVRAHLNLGTIEGGFLESITFHWKGANSQIQTVYNTGTAGGQRSVWADEPFFEESDVQAYDAELAELEDYEFESTFEIPTNTPVTFTHDGKGVNWTVEVECRFKGTPTVSTKGSFVVDVAATEQLTSTDESAVARDDEVAFSFADEQLEQLAQSIEIESE